MAKVIRLKLTKIKYSGDSIGDDIRIEIDCLDKVFDLEKKIKLGAEITINAEIGQFFFDQATTELPLTIRIIEQDLIFNDVGSTQEKFKINLKNSASQYLTAVIAIQELRNYKTKKKAMFTVTLEAQVSDTILYVAYQEGGDGWILGKREDTKKNIDLISCLKVRLEHSDPLRQYFTIGEGAFQGIKASVKIKTDGTSYLQTENPHTAPVHLIYSLSKKTLLFGKQSYTTRDYKDDLLRKGVYDIEIPDYSHAGGEYYLSWAKLAKVWFRIGHDGKRYLHLGTFSLGCITLTERNRWDDLCKVLMKARRGDGKSIGVLEVIE